MKFPSRFKRKRKKRSTHTRKISTEPAGLLTSAAIACGTGLGVAIAASLLLSIIALLCGFGSTLISALGYFTAVLSFAVCGFIAGKRGRAALPSGILAACGMTLFSIVLSFLPLPSGTELTPLADVFIRLGLAAVAVIFSIIGSNR